MQKINSNRSGPVKCTEKDKNELMHKHVQEDHNTSAARIFRKKNGQGLLKVKALIR